ncbi:MAG: hypothetical protein JOZ97_09390 [Candidatus Eremiobacteraeota bacterium]|nr:hypothetical protein [Candidatus Eremiobacteraeota bacterium]
MRERRAALMPPNSLNPGLSELQRTAPLWVQPLRWTAASSMTVYYSLAYRITGWGTMSWRRGSTLLVANHQHEIESPAIVALMTVRTLSWRYPIFTVSSRRMWEPGFLAQRIPWLAFMLSAVNLGPMFSALGMQPIENELHARPFASLAYTLHQKFGDLKVNDVFKPRALERLPQHVRRLSDLLPPRNPAVGQTVVTLSELNDPYKQAALTQTREQLDEDLLHFERLARAGATIFLAPEGFYSGDGRMQRLRGVLSRLQPLATVWLLGISYDPFVGKRLSLLYRLARAVERVPLDVQLKRLRPVTTSALIATWLRAQTEPFTAPQAFNAVGDQLASLPRGVFVEPRLQRNPQKLTLAALDGMTRLGTLLKRDNTYVLTQRRSHPQFPRTRDMIEYQANFHAETLAGAEHVAA